MATASRNNDDPNFSKKKDSEYSSLLIRNGTCVLPHPQIVGGLIEIEADVLVENGIIKEIGIGLPQTATQVFDAKGLHVLPGLIDSQVHFREPGLEHKEDIESGSRAAALGGITAFFEMPNTNPATTTKELHEDKIKRSVNRSHVHYAYFVGGSSENAHELSSLEKLPHCPGTKIFMGSSTGTLLVDSDEVLEQIAKNGRKLLVVHSEDEQRMKERKHIALNSQDVHNHPVWRDVESAMISTEKIVALSKKYNRRTHILHISTAEEMEFLKLNKTSQISVEVLPQHLTLFAPECYDRLGTLAQQNPPIREKRHLERIWKAVLDGTVDVMGSDHAPHTLEEKLRTYPSSPGGIPGVQTMVPIMLNHVHEQRLSLTRMVHLLSEGPRRVFGVPGKGRLAVGLDADITIVDTKVNRKIESKLMASKCGWTPFDNMKVVGFPFATILKGQFVMREGSLLASGKGEAVEFI